MTNEQKMQKMEEWITQRERMKAVRWLRKHEKRYAQAIKRPALQDFIAKLEQNGEMRRHMVVWLVGCALENMYREQILNGMPESEITSEFVEKNYSGWNRCRDAGEQDARWYVNRFLKGEQDEQV